jgi:hypothetical protein
MSDRPAQVIPNIYVDSIEEVRDFYINQLGFAHMMGVVGQDGRLVVDPPKTQWWGDRTFSVRDPYGYQLWFYQHVSEVAPPPGVTVV